MFLLLASLIKGVQLFVNQQQIYTLENFFQFKSYIETVCSFDKSATNCHVESSGMFELEEWEKKTEKLTKHSKIFDMLLHLNLVQTSCLLVPNSSVHLKIIFADESFYLFEKTIGSGDNLKSSKSKLNLLDIKLNIQAKVMRETHLLILEQQLSKKSAQYYFKKSQVTIHTLSPGGSSYEISNILHNKKPNFVVLAFVQNSSLYDANASPFEFKAHEINSLALMLNGQPFSQKAIQFSFEENQLLYSQVFSKTIEALNIKNSNSSNLLTFENYPKNFLIAYDLTPSRSATSNLIHETSIVSLGLSVSLKKILDKALSVILYTMSDACFSIDGNRSVQLLE